MTKEKKTIAFKARPCEDQINWIFNNHNSDEFYKLIGFALGKNLFMRSKSFLTLVESLKKISEDIERGVEETALKSFVGKQGIKIRVEME